MPYLYIDEPFKELVLSNIRDKSNKVFATVAYKYFKLTNQFFGDAHKNDVNYIAKQLGLNKHLDWQSYNKDSRRTHKQLILEFLGVSAFVPDNIPPDIRLDLENDARVLRPFKQCFIHIANKLKENKTEIPSYETLEKIRRSSTVAWEHIIIHGAFDFSESKLKDSLGFDFDKMLDPKIFKEIDDD